MIYFIQITGWVKRSGTKRRECANFWVFFISKATIYTCVCKYQHMWSYAHFRSDMRSRDTMHNHLYRVFEFVFTQSVKPQCLYWIALLIPGCIIILIFPSILYTSATISLANEVWNELWEQHLVKCLYSTHSIPYISIHSSEIHLNGKHVRFQCAAETQTYQIYLILLVS